MNTEIKLIGYSSDACMERIIYNGNMNSNKFGNVRKSKLVKREERRNKLFSKEPPLELDEWFVYLVDGEKWYFKVSQDLNVLRMLHTVEFLGIGRPNQPVHKSDIKAEIKQIRNKLGEHGKCCYCEIKLTKEAVTDPTHKTKEHVIPRHKGGKFVKTACYECNQEKGGLMLHSYIQMLNYQLSDKTGDELVKLQTKIKNTNRIAKELEDLANKQK